MQLTAIPRPTALRQELATAIRASARRLLEQKGFVGVSMDEVAASIRMSKPTIYSIYADKKALLAAAGDEIVRGFDTTFATAFERDAGSLREYLADLPRPLKAMWRELEQSQLMRLLLSERANLPEMVTTFKALHWDTGHKTWSEIFSRAIENGKFEPMRPETAVRLVRAPVINIVVERILFGQDHVSDAAVDEYIEQSCAAVALAFCRD